MNFDLSLESTDNLELGPHGDDARDRDAGSEGGDPCVVRVDELALGTRQPVYLTKPHGVLVLRKSASGVT
jgi:hypothetical protein